MSKVSWHSATNRYKKVCGQAIGKDGTAKPKVFYFGQDANSAEALATLIAQRWAGVKASGGGVWSDGDLEAISALIKSSGMAGNGNGNGNHVSPAIVPPVPVSTGLTFHGAIEAFKVQVLQDPSRSKGWQQELLRRLETIKTSSKDMPLSSLRFDETKALVNYWLARPNKCSVATAKNHLASLRQLLTWLDDSDKWNAPKGFHKIFRVDFFATMTAKERSEASKPIPVISVADLAKAYKNARPLLRALILLALNCGMTQIEIASLTLADLRDGRIVRYRAKTGGKILGNWNLWEETRIAIALAIGNATNRPKSDNDLLLTTQGGKPLVWFNDENRIDSVGQSWRDLLIRQGIKPILSFKYLRKTASDMIRKASDRDTSETFLAHADETTGRFYNDPDFGKLDKALEIVRKQLQPLFNP